MLKTYSMGGAASVLGDVAYGGSADDLEAPRAEVLRLRTAMREYAKSAVETATSGAADVELAAALLAASEERWDAASSDPEAAHAEALLLRTSISSHASAAAALVEAASTKAPDGAAPGEASTAAAGSLSGSTKPLSVLTNVKRFPDVSASAAVQALVAEKTAALDEQLAAESAASQAELMTKLTSREFLASRLHDVWRSARPRTPGGTRWDPRPKLVDGVTYDIANLEFIDLPQVFKRSNTASAEVALDAVEDKVAHIEAGGKGSEFGSDAFIDEGSSLVHDVWMEMNRMWADPSLLVPFDELPEDEKEKDRMILRDALEVWKLYNPDAALAAAVASSPAASTRARRKSIIEIIAGGIKAALSSSPERKAAKAAKAASPQAS